jgi:hypothetical protein
MLNNIINTLSILQGSRYAKAYAKGNSAKADRLLASYISLRQRLPRMGCGNHYGNHKGSQKLPWASTQNGL